jgi:hypothetical protein
MDQTGKVDKAFKRVKAAKAPAVAPPMAEDEWLHVSLECPAEGVFFARLCHSSGVSIDIRSLDVMSLAIGHFQTVRKDWANADRRYRQSQKSKVQEAAEGAGVLPNTGRTSTGQHGDAHVATAPTEPPREADVPS